VRIGAQVSQAGGWLAALRRAEDMGAEVVQLFAQSNRQWRPPPSSDELYACFRQALGASPVVGQVVCHAPYLINLISPDRPTARRSRSFLVANLRAATALGATALVLHPGSHRGVGEGSALARVGRAARRALEEAEQADGRVCQLLFENTAGAGGTVGRTTAELARLVEAAGADPRVGVCLDTQHLFASGVAFATPEEAQAVVEALLAALGPGRLRLLHLNDSKVPLGANRDRHANLGEGWIGAGPLACLLGQPDLQGLAAVLEVPGAGQGPRPADLQAARELHRAGLARLGEGPLPKGRGPRRAG